MEHQPILALAEMCERIAALKLLPRTGWLQRGVAAAESVADHSFGVALLALLVGDSVAGVDRGRLLAIALLHDLSEVLVGDLPASARRLIGAEVKREAERAALAELVAAFPARAEYMALWEEYTSGASREARLVKALDRIEMLAQTLSYERAGSRTLDEFWRDVGDGWDEEFPELRELALLVAERRPC
jgi:putative hydrolase of HD superfamily